MGKFWGHCGGGVGKKWRTGAQKRNISETRRSLYIQFFNHIGYCYSFQVLVFNIAL